jgi:hypothetical protein
MQVYDAVARLPRDMPTQHQRVQQFARQVVRAAKHVDCSCSRIEHIECAQPYALSSTHVYDAIERTMRTDTTPAL